MSDLFSQIINNDSSLNSNSIAINDKNNQVDPNNVSRNVFINNHSSIQIQGNEQIVSEEGTRCETSINYK